MGGSISGLGRSPGVRNGNWLQDSCLENSMDRGAWQATVDGAAKSQTGLTEQNRLKDTENRLEVAKLEGGVAHSGGKAWESGLSRGKLFTEGG